MDMKSDDDEPADAPAGEQTVTDEQAVTDNPICPCGQWRHDPRNDYPYNGWWVQCDYCFQWWHAQCTEFAQYKTDDQLKNIDNDDKWKCYNCNKKPKSGIKKPKSKKLCPRKKRGIDDIFS